MRLLWLELRDFRSYTELRLEPHPGLNVLVGPNGSGKTSLAEAVSYLSALKSFRGVPDAALVKADAAAAIIRGEFTNTSTHLVEVELPAAGRRRVQLDGKRPKRYSAVAATIPIVAFQPDDLELIKGGPAGRRGYLDDLAASLSPLAGADQDEYARLLKQRNALLRAEGPEASVAQLATWEEALAGAAAAVLRRRLDAAKDLVPVLGDAYGEIGQDTEVNWRYAIAGLADSRGGSLDLEAPEGAQELYIEAFERNRRRDMERRLTTVGPHRDAVDLSLAGRDARTQASQGEQRTLALALRLGAFDLMVERLDERPVLIADDVFSELDDRRAEGVVRRLPETQVFVTTARPVDLPGVDRVWAIEAGSVT